MVYSAAAAYRVDIAIGSCLHWWDKLAVGGLTAPSAIYIELAVGGLTVPSACIGEHCLLHYPAFIVLDPLLPTLVCAASWFSSFSQGGFERRIC